jgi:predicted ATP-grasp superfamily ATP-dependent carboligase
LPAHERLSADVRAALDEPMVDAGLRPLPGTPTGALVLGSDYRALGIVRSLGRRGVPVCVLTSGDDRLAAFSRYAAHTFEWPHEETARLELLAELAARDGRIWALFPSSDEAAAFVARNHAKLAPLLALTTPPWNVLQWAYDKRRTHELANLAGVDYPWTIYPRDRHDLEREDLRFPLVLKPAIKPTFNRLTAAKAWRVDDRASLLRRYDEACELVDRDVLFVQELIGGGGTTQLSFAALADSGVVLSSLVAQRTRQYPADFGRASTFVETIADPGIAAPSLRLIDACGFSGLLEIEYKVEARTGRTLLLDINPRVWGWHTLCARAGVDFPWLLWLRLRGEDAPAAEARPGVRWVRLSTDLPTAAKEIARGRLSAWKYVVSLCPPHEGAIFARDDVRPGLVELPLLVRTLARRLLARGGV